MRKYALHVENVYTYVQEARYQFLKDVTQLLMWKAVLVVGFVKKAVQLDV